MNPPPCWLCGCYGLITPSNPELDFTLHKPTAPYEKEHCRVVQVCEACHHQLVDSEGNQRDPTGELEHWGCKCGEWPPTED